MLLQETTTFWEFNIGHIFDAFLVLFAGLAYTLSRKHDIREAQSKREEMIQLQVKMHTENTISLENLKEFHVNQLEINRKRDEQISLLREQTATISQMAKGLHDRLTLMENRHLGS